MIQVSAAIRLRPNPPARVLSKNTLVSASLKNLSIPSWRSSNLTRPSNWTYLYLIFPSHTRSFAHFRYFENIDLPFNFQTFTNQVKDSGELAENQGLVALVAQPIKHLMKHLHLSAAVNYMLWISLLILKIRSFPFHIWVIAGRSKVLLWKAWQYYSI